MSYTSQLGGLEIVLLMTLFGPRSVTPLVFLLGLLALS